MRGLVVACYLLFCTALACAADAPATLRLVAGGFASDGANFGVTLAFSDLKLAPQLGKQPEVLTSPGMAAPADEWTGPDGIRAHLDVCCLKWPMGLNDMTLAAARLVLTNPSDSQMHTTLSVRIAPQGKLHALSFEQHAFLIEGRLILVSDTPSRGAILAESPFAPRPLSPQDSTHVESAKGECRGEMLFDLTLPPGQTQTLGFICPVWLPKGSISNLDFYRALTVDQLFAAAQKQLGAGDHSKP